MSVENEEESTSTLREKRRRVVIDPCGLLDPDEAPYRIVPKERIYLRLLPGGEEPPEDEPSKGWISWLQCRIPELQDFPGVSARRVFQTVPGCVLETLRSVASYDRNPFSYEERYLWLYFVLDCPTGSDLAGLLAALSGKVHIRYPEAGVELFFSPSYLFRGLDLYRLDVRLECNSGHLETAPQGIDARYAWRFPGSDGAGLRFVDVESGWDLRNQDLLDANVVLSSGVNRLKNNKHHGTAVLGIVAASRNTIGVQGIAPGTSSVRVVSIQRDEEIQNIPDAILAAIGEMRFGDVLLLELYATYDKKFPARPMEVEPAVFDAIRFATDLGIAIIEPSGNAGSDLDLFPSMGDLTNPQPMFDRGRLDSFRDSGAIVVSASSRPFEPLQAKWNYGSRVDCYSWGEGICSLYQVMSLRFLDLLRQLSPEELVYTRLILDLTFLLWLLDERPPRPGPIILGQFTDTSAATAVIAGTALSVQGMAQAHLGYRFSPWQLRLILSDPANGTPPQVPQKGNIGVMPDLKKVVRGVLNIPADIYLRDRLGDTGESPRGRWMESPDILVLAQLPQDPQKEFGEGSGREDDDLTRVNAQPAAGEPCHVGLRLRNRGGREAEDVRARIFYAPAATLLVPSLWRETGNVTLPSMPEADLLTVSSFLDTKAPVLPDALSTGPYHAWIAILHHPDDPGPEEEDLQNWDRFLKIQHTDNNFVIRNLHAVPHVTGGGEKDPEAWLKLPFLVAGADDCKRVMRIEVLSRLPRDCQVWIDMPPEFCDLRQVSSVIVPCVFCSEDLVQLPVNPNGKHYFREVPLDPGQTHRLSLWVHVPPLQRRHAYRVTVRQICDGEAVGRVTWRLIPRSA